MNEVLQQFVNIAGIGVVVGGSMGGIVLIIDYVITSVLQMLKGR